MKQLEQILNVTNAELDALDMNYIYQYNFYHDVTYFLKPSGREHYRLLAYVSSIFDGETLYDVGTNKCMSAAGLCFNFKNKVKSYDLQTYIPMNPILPNVIYNIGDVTLDEKLIKSPFIFFDVDHDGKFEKIFFDHLRKIGYKGLVMCDDIKLEPYMIPWWDSIPEEKYDISNIGHWSGTGLVHFK